MKNNKKTKQPLSIKKLQNYRIIVQFLFFILTATLSIINLKLTLIVILILTLLGGVFYCGWICPFGLVQELFGKLGTKLKIKKRKVPQNIHKYLKYTRYILLFLVIFTSYDFIFKLLTYDSRANFQTLLTHHSIILSSLTVIIIFGIFSMFYERLFCNYLCIQGAKYGIFSLVRIFTITRDDEKCVNCKKCDRVCPMNIEVSKYNYVRDSHCINCLQCVSNCPIPNTLKYSHITEDKQELKRYAKILVLALVIGAGYFGYQKKLETTNKTNVTSVIGENIDIAKNIADGIYSGSGDGFGGSTIIEVTVKNEQITSIDIISNEDDPDWFDRAKEKLLPAIIEKQSIEIDTVAGATFSSNGILSAVKSALGIENSDIESKDETAEELPVSDENNTEIETDETVKSINLASGIADGVYRGSGEGFGGGTTIVDVTVKNEIITSIEAVSYEDDPDWFEWTKEELFPKILKNQNTEIDSIAGATFSSEGIKSAVKNAFEIDNSSNSTTINEENVTNETIESVNIASGIADGVYRGSGEGFGGGTTVVDVTVKNEAITSIEAVSYEDDPDWFEWTKEELFPKILKNQNTEIDSIAGATFSSEGIKSAVLNAIESAKK